MAKPTYLKQFHNLIHFKNNEKLIISLFGIGFHKIYYYFSLYNAEEYINKLLSVDIYLNKQAPRIPHDNSLFLKVGF